MRNVTKLLVAVSAALLLFSGQAIAVELSARLAPHSLIVSDTLQYGHIVSHNARGRQSAHYLLFQPGGDVRPIVYAGGHVFGAANLSTIASRAQHRGHNVLGGINADFFSFQTGIPEGLYISNGALRSSHQGRSAVLFREDGSAFFANPYLTFTLTNQGSPGSNNAGHQITTSFFNKFRQPGFLFLMDEHFSNTTRTTAPGREVFFRIVEGQMTVGGTVTLEVANILNSTGAVAIPEGHIILSADRTSPHLEQLDRFAVGDQVTLRVNTTDARAGEAVWATGAGDILVQNGVTTSGWDPGVGGAHPRTALGLRPDGGVILYTVDGRAPGHSAGLTLAELAQSLTDLGATEVINLDGGGSTSFSFRLPGTSSTAIRNRPSDGGLRNVATSILLTSRYGADGQPAHIQFEPGYARILAGSLVTPHQLSGRLTMTDRGYFPLNPANLSFDTYTADPALGQQEGSAFRTAVSDTRGLLTARATNGALGSMRIALISRPDDVVVRTGNTAISYLSLTSGDRVQLTFQALSAGAALIASQDMFEINITGNVGTLDETGVFTASGTIGSQGTLTVTAGGVRRYIPITLASAFPDVTGHWAEGYIISMRTRGVVTGIPTPQGTMFLPAQNVTRAEFSAMLARLLELDTAAYQLSGMEFIDHAEIPAWSRPYVAAMLYHGYMAGRATPTGARFDATAPITRAEAFAVLGRLIPTAASEDVLTRFQDYARIPAWARADIARLTQAGLISGTEDGSLAPDQNISRAETAAILARLDSLHTQAIQAPISDKIVADQSDDGDYILVPAPEDTSEQEESVEEQFPEFFITE